jgi:DNA-binding PadR family transcriptional regulator
MCKLSDRELQELCILQEVSEQEKTVSEIARALADNKWNLSADEVWALLEEMRLHQLVSFNFDNVHHRTNCSISQTGKQRLRDLIETRDGKGEFSDLVEKTTKFLDQNYPQFSQKNAEALPSVNIQLSEDALDTWWNLLSPEEKGEVASAHWESELASRTQLRFCGKDAR